MPVCVKCPECESHLRLDDTSHVVLEGVTTFFCSQCQIHVGLIVGIIEFPSMGNNGHPTIPLPN